MIMDELKMYEIEIMMMTMLHVYYFKIVVVYDGAIIQRKLVLVGNGADFILGVG